MGDTYAQTIIVLPTIETYFSPVPSGEPVAKLALGPTPGLGFRGLGFKGLRV